tara:strand:- start:7 stop:309 length:303 start_codon:yes stop_codon:yes gene_type:complete
VINFLERYKILFSILFYLAFGNKFLASIAGLDESSAFILKFVSSVLLFGFWVIILLDMILNKLRDKTFWILSMFFIAFMAPVVYLFRRQKSLREPARYSI